jgi:hypothetical protein
MRDLRAFAPSGRADAGAVAPSAAAGLVNSPAVLLHKPRNQRDCALIDKIRFKRIRFKSKSIEPQFLVSFVSN